jgi:hypothetical protein
MGVSSLQTGYQILISFVVDAGSYPRLGLILGSNLKNEKEFVVSEKPVW